MAGEDNLGLGTPPEVADEQQGSPPPQEVSSVVTKDQAEAKALEAQTVWSSAMDQMEASRATQGDYFISLGQKTDEGDGRAFVLISPADDHNYDTVVVITPDGPKISASKQSLLTNVIHAEGQTDWENVNEGTGFTKGRDGAHNLLAINIRSLKQGGDTINSFVELADLTDEGVLNQAVDRSVAKAEAPHKNIVEAAQAKIGIGTSLAAKIGALPPKV